jgi:hypothetical protein
MYTVYLTVCVVEEHHPSLHSNGKVYRVRWAIFAVCEGLFYTSVISRSFTYMWDIEDVINDDEIEGRNGNW